VKRPPRREEPEERNTLELYGKSRGALVRKVRPGEGARVSGRLRLSGTPRFHTVRRSDTLWDLCDHYFRDPWRWPRLWALNPSITNPHWIYPGDRIRLRKGAPKPRTRAAVPRLITPRRKPTAPGTIYLKQRGFIAEKDLKYAAKIAGSREEKLMLATYDHVYIRYPRKKPLKVGERYEIYKAIKPVTHPDGKQRLGQIVEVFGEVEIKKLSSAQVAHGVILRAVNPVRRGYLVGPLKQRFKAVQPVRNPRTPIEGTVVAVLDDNHLIGTKQLVFLDRGKKFNVKEGYTFYVSRRGDSYRAINQFRQQTKPDERKWPPQYVATIVVVDVGWNHSVGYVSHARKEIRIGDAVALRVPKNPEQQ